MKTTTKKMRYSQNGDIKIYPNIIWICVPSEYLFPL